MVGLLLKFQKRLTERGVGLMAARINEHHIYYDPDWIVELNWLQHKTVTNVQQMNATGENFAKVTNFMHALSHEWNRMRASLDTEEDMRIRFRGKEMFKPKPKIRRRRKKK